MLGGSQGVEIPQPLSNVPVAWKVEQVDCGDS